ncbi:MAG: iron-containing alcohol dehydrogenase [Lautropia sp.]
MTLLLDLPRIHFGPGCAERLPEVLTRLGVRRPLLVTDRGVRASGAIDGVLALLGGPNALVFDGVTEPPCFAAIELAAAAYRSAACDGVVAAGGGSVIDTAKMLAILATHPGSVERYAGHADRIVTAVAPLVVLPTTAGSGSEVSPSTGIHPAAGRPGLRTRSSALVPRAALCDPELTVSMPPRLTAATGLDALTHCIEGFLSPIENPLVDAIALAGIPRIAGRLVRAVSDGSDRDARASLMMGALAGGIGIGKGLGPAHAMATAFSHWPVPHGILAALSLPPSLELLQRHVPAKLATVAAAMGLPPGVSVADGFRSLLRSLNARSGIPLTLHAAGVRGGDQDALAQDCADSPVNRSSPYVPTAAEYRQLIAAAIG